MFKTKQLIFNVSIKGTIVKTRFEDPLSKKLFKKGDVKGFKILHVPPDTALPNHYCLVGVSARSMRGARRKVADLCQVDLKYLEMVLVSSE